MKLKIDHRVYDVDSYREASRIWEAVRDFMDYGSSNMPRVYILDDGGKKHAHISYNGKVWQGDVVIYNPYQWG